MAVIYFLSFGVKIHLPWFRKEPAVDTHDGPIGN